MADGVSFLFNLESRSLNLLNKIAPEIKEWYICIIAYLFFLIDPKGSCELVNKVYFHYLTTRFVCANSFLSRCSYI